MPPPSSSVSPKAPCVPLKPLRRQPHRSRPHAAPLAAQLPRRTRPARRNHQPEIQATDLTTFDETEVGTVGTQAQPRDSQTERRRTPSAKKAGGYGITLRDAMPSATYQSDGIPSPLPCLEKIPGFGAEPHLCDNRHFVIHAQKYDVTGPKTRCQSGNPSRITRPQFGNPTRQRSGI